MCLERERERSPNLPARNTSSWGQQQQSVELCNTSSCSLRGITAGLKHVRSLCGCVYSHYIHTHNLADNTGEQNRRRVLRTQNPVKRSFLCSSLYAPPPQLGLPLFNSVPQKKVFVGIKNISLGGHLHPLTPSLLRSSQNSTYRRCEHLRFRFVMICSPWTARCCLSWSPPHQALSTVVQRLVAD